MEQYHKIQTVFLRDPETKFKTLLYGQYAKPEFEYLKDNKWIFTEKVDGTNIRVMFDGSTITFGGKTDRAQMPGPLVTRLQETFLPQADKFADKFPDGVCLYGEGFGGKIQKASSTYGMSQDFALFDVKIGDYWLYRENVEEIAKEFGLIVAPVIGRGNLAYMVSIAQSGYNSAWGEFHAEGVVARPDVELTNRYGERVITKLKYKDFN